MRLRIFTLPLIVVLASTLAFAQSTSVKPVSSYLTPGKSYDYKISIKIDGDTRPANVKDTQKLNAILDLVIRHKVGKGIAEGETQSVMSVQSAAFTVDDQKISLSPTTFPQITVIVDGKGKVKNVFGASGPGMPGLNFSNFILFMLPDSSMMQSTASIPEGTKWERTVSLSDTKQSVKVTSTVKGSETIKDKPGMLVEQVYELAKPTDDNPNAGLLKSFKGTGKTTYLTPDCRPVKSHAEIEVVGLPTAVDTKTDSGDEKNASAQQDPGAFNAKLLIDLTAVE